LTVFQSAAEGRVSMARRKGAPGPSPLAAAEEAAGKLQRLLGALLRHPELV
jgi:hypothetical protein